MDRDRSPRAIRELVLRNQKVVAETRRVSVGARARDVEGKTAVREPVKETVAAEKGRVKARDAENKPAARKAAGAFYYSRRRVEMPGFNACGPTGAGPMTGHGGGYCMRPVDPEVGWVPGLGRGGGRGRRNCINAVGSPWRARISQGSLQAGAVCSPAAGGEQELDLLRTQVGKT